jgi:hypothetical protein
MAATIQCTIRGDKAWRRALVGGQEKLASVVGVALEKAADEVIAWIGNHQASIFTNPTGNLRNNLFREEFKAFSTRVRVRAGWMQGGWYGRVLEYGPRNKGPKPILPGKSLSTGGRFGTDKGVGMPTRALRWVSGGAVIYRRRSTYLWKPSMKRPHWRKAADELRGHRNSAMRRAVKAAITGAMR